MAVEQRVYDLSLKAGGDLSEKQYRGMQISDDFTCTTAEAADAALIGVLQNKPEAAGRAAEVRREGITKLVLGADSLTAGTEVTTDSSGKFVAAGSGERYCAVLLEGGDDGDTVSAVMEFGHHD